MKKTNSLKKDFAQIADIVNSFKAESVQLKVLEFILEKTFKYTTETQTQKNANARKKSMLVNFPSIKVKGKKSKVGRHAKKGRPGPGVTLKRLLQSGFFKKRRTIAEIISHAGSKLGFHYKTKELSIPLIRFIRDGKIDRDKNTKNQFVYFKK
jgi:hypothetical protein